MSMFLSTERLHLTPVLTKDAPLLFSLTSQEKVSQFMRFGLHKTCAETENFIKEYHQEGNYGFSVWLKNPKELIGFFGLKREKNGYLLSTFLSSAYWNQGYSTELLKMIESYAQETLHAAFFAAYVVSENIASRKVLEKNCYHIEKTLYFDDLPKGLLIYQKNFPASEPVEKGGEEAGISESCTQF